MEDRLQARGRVAVKRIYEKDFHYVPASHTDIAKTFARVRRELKDAEQAKQPAPNVTALKKAKRS